MTIGPKNSNEKGSDEANEVKGIFLLGTSELRDKIQQQTRGLIAEKQADLEREKLGIFDKRLNRARREIEEKFIEICQTIGNMRGGAMRGVMDTYLSNQIIHFEVFSDRHLNNISEYGKVPEDFVKNCKDKLSNIRLLVERKKKELI